MPKLPVLTPAELIKILLKNGFEIDRINGSHHVLINKSSKIRLVVPVHKKDLPKETLYEIIKQSGLKTDIFA